MLSFRNWFGVCRSQEVHGNANGLDMDPSVKEPLTNRQNKAVDFADKVEATL